MNLEDFRDQSLYLDSNIIIYAVETGNRWSDVLRTLFLAIEAGEFIAVTSELTLAEVLARPLELGTAELIETYEALLEPGSLIKTVPIDRAVLKTAARHQGPRQLKLADAIHLATASEQNCDAFVSNDERLGRKLPPEMRWIGLGFLRDRP